MPLRHLTTRSTSLHRAAAALALAGALSLSGCGEMDILNTNAPTIETLTGAPTRTILARAATGIF
jgi:hypothetical protein